MTLEEALGRFVRRYLCALGIVADVMNMMLSHYWQLPLGVFAVAG